MMNNMGMANPMMMNNMGMENQMMMNNMEMVNPMIMNNVGMMNPMMMNNMGMMNPMMMNNMGMMNPMMMNNDGINFENQNNNFIHQDNNLEHPGNTNYKKIYLQIEENKFKPIIINKDDDFNTVRNKLLSYLKFIGKPLCRDPYLGEIIERTSPHETLEYLIERGVYECYPNIEKFNGRRVYKVEEIRNGDKLYLDIPLRGAGGPFIEFADVDKISKTKKLKFSKNAKKWRKVSQGLNLFGKCINKKCEAYDNEVIYPAGINIKFDINLRSKEIKCPICSKNFIPLTLGFWKCEYQIKGEKLKDGEYISVNINGKETKGNDFEYYDTKETGKVFWSKLIIFVGYIQEMKYKE